MQRLENIFDDEDEYGEKCKKKDKKKAKTKGIQNFFSKVVTKPPPKQEVSVDEPDEDLADMLKLVDSANPEDLLSEEREEVLIEAPFQSKNKFKRNPSPSFLSPKPIKLRKKEASPISKTPVAKFEPDSVENDDMDFDDVKVPSPVKRHLSPPPTSTVEDAKPVKTEIHESLETMKVEEVNETPSQLEDCSNVEIAEIVEEEPEPPRTSTQFTDYVVTKKMEQKLLNSSGLMLSRKPSIQVESICLDSSKQDSLNMKVAVSFSKEFKDACSSLREKKPPVWNSTKK